ncbi:Flp1 family type IVb pilin [Virgibacillus halophilus]
MKTFLTDFWNDEEGMETIEMLLILSVLIVIAVMFKEKIKTWADQLFSKINKEMKID